MASSVAVPFLKPNWFPTSKLLAFKRSVTLIYNASSKTIEMEVNSDMGLQLVGFTLFPFLYIGFTIENFTRSGKIPDKMDLLEM